MADALFENLTDTSFASKVFVSFAVPHRTLMYKLMRSCIAVRRAEDLWIHIDLW